MDFDLHCSVSKEMEFVVKSVGLASFYRHRGHTWKDQRH